MTTTSKEQALIAIDLGTPSYIAGNGKKGSFAFIVTRYKDTSGLAMGVAKDVFTTKDNRTFLVGDACRDEGADSRSTDSALYSSNEIHILRLKVLADSDIPNPIIVTGLPTELHEREEPKPSRITSAAGRKERATTYS